MLNVAFLSNLLRTVKTKGGGYKTRYLLCHEWYFSSGIFIGADVQKITLTTPFFTFLTKSEKHILSNIKLTLYTTQGKFSLHPIDWKTIDITANKKKGIFDYDSVSYKDGSYASATELETYIYALPLMQFLTEQNMIIQQDQDLLKTIYFGDLIFNLISKVVIVGIIGFLLYQLISDFNG